MVFVYLVTTLIQQAKKVISRIFKKFEFFLINFKFFCRLMTCLVSISNEAIWKSFKDMTTTSWSKSISSFRTFGENFTNARAILREETTPHPRSDNFFNLHLHGVGKTAHSLHGNARKLILIYNLIFYNLDDFCLLVTTLI